MTLPTPETPMVSYVIITMNRPDDSETCLRSVLSQNLPDAEVIVVDNASTDDTRDRVRRDFPTVRLIDLPENRGVSGGRNAGAEASRGRVCIFIDDDATFADCDAGARTLEYFNADPELATVGFTIHDAQTGVEEMKSIPRRDKRMMNDDYEATYFCGAGFAMRRKAFLEAGMFWDPLVYGSQEIDLAYRLLDQGWRIIHSASIRVLHKSSPIGRPSGQWIYFNARDRAWVAARNLPWLAVVTTTLCWWGNTALVACQRGMVGRFFAGMRDCLIGLPAAVRLRRRVKPATISCLKKHSGRLWY